MTDLLELIVAFAVFSFAWRGWKRSMRDFTRDQLFDLRDEWRRFWIEGGRDPEDPDYARVRHRINLHLRYTNGMRLVGLFYIAMNAPRAKRLLEGLPDFNVAKDPEVGRKIKAVMNAAATSLQVYMVMTSLLLFPMIVIAAVQMACAKSAAVGTAVRKTAVAISSRIRPLNSENIEVAVAAFAG